MKIKIKSLKSSNTYIRVLASFLFTFIPIKLGSNAYLFTAVDLELINEGQAMTGGVYRRWEAGVVGFCSRGRRAMSGQNGGGVRLCRE